MKKLHVNFVGRGARVPWAGRVLMAVAVVFAGDVALSYKQVRDAIAVNETTMREQPRVTVARAIAPEEVAVVSETVNRIGMPWEKLFGALESAANGEVALLGIEPDPKTGTVVISGDGKNYLAALSYVLNLSRSDALAQVQLVRHDTREKDPQGPVSFAVSAAWREGKP
jgi:hypothetical protein